MLRYLKMIFSTLLITFSIPCFADPASALLKNQSDPVAGNKNGEVTVVEFFDYQCSHCSNMSPVLQKIIRSNPNVRIVFKEFPIRGPISEYAARAALAANKQGKYYAFNHALMMSRYTLTESKVNEIAKQNGLNITRLNKDMHSKAVTQQIVSTYNLARDLGLNGTPVLFVGKTNASKVDELNFILGEVSQSELQSAINSAIK